MEPSNCSPRSSKSGSAGGFDCENIDNEVYSPDTAEEPTIGKTFDNFDSMSSYIKSYAKSQGFPVKCRTSKKGKDGVLKYVTFVCSRSGNFNSKSSNQLNPQPSMKIGCETKIGGYLDECGRWKISRLLIKHNHSLSPSKARFFRCYRELNTSAKRQLEINDEAGIPLHKSFTSFVVEAGGHENVSFLEKDCRNYVEKVRRLQLVEGDASALQSYFLRMQENNSDFFYSIDLDDEGRLRNVFWADARSRAARKEFGEVITFDTTYLTNKYDMPFAPFVGVNHHGQSVLLGCGLVSCEDIETFTWLFQMWLTCMEGEAPNGIITDQDKAMKRAIEIVFPNSRHRWCLWHIMKKSHEKLRGYKQYESINFMFHNIVYDSQYPDEFEKNWETMIAKYQLSENEWLTGLYIERRRWVPCFVKDSFWAGMSTTQRSESINAFFDGFVHAKTTLKQFVGQYENALAKKVEKESHEDSRSANTQIPCITKYVGIEQRAQEVYTISKFQEFQKELTGKMYCDLLSSKETGMVLEYDVQEDIEIGEGMKRVVFNVLFDKNDCYVRCSCRRFEFRGILCRHALAVMIRNNMLELHDKYILRRWRKDVQRSHTRVKVTYDRRSTTVEQSRFDLMCKAFIAVADEAANEQESCDYVMNWIAGAPKSMPKKKMDTLPNVTSIDKTDRQGILDPVVKRTKGRPPSKRKESLACRKQSQRKKKNQTNKNMEIDKGVSVVVDVDTSSKQRCSSIEVGRGYHFSVAKDDSHLAFQFQSTPNTLSSSPSITSFYPNVATWNSEFVTNQNISYNYSFPMSQPQQKYNLFGYEEASHSKNPYDSLSDL